MFYELNITTIIEATAFFRALIMFFRGDNRKEMYNG